MKRFAGDTILGDSRQQVWGCSDNYINFVIKLRELSRDESLGFLRRVFEYRNFCISESLIGVGDVKVDSAHNFIIL